jgi:hypothetical protein
MPKSDVEVFRGRVNQYYGARLAVVHPDKPVNDKMEDLLVLVGRFEDAENLGDKAETLFVFCGCHGNHLRFRWASEKAIAGNEFRVLGPQFQVEFLVSIFTSYHHASQQPRNEFRVTYSSHPSTRSLRSLAQGVLLPSHLFPSSNRFTIFLF